MYYVRELANHPLNVAVMLRLAFDTLTRYP